MGKEIERKFLIKYSEWNELQKTSGKHLRQGYLLSDPEKTIRVRTADEHAWITIKGKSVGATRLEYEYEIPLQDGIELLSNFAESPLEKVRHEIINQSKTWEVDVFLGDNAGLIVAEIELESEDEGIDLPNWVGEEVTGDIRYYNSNLIKNPFKTWNQ